MVLHFHGQWPTLLRHTSRIDAQGPFCLPSRLLAPCLPQSDSGGGQLVGDKAQAELQRRWCSGCAHEVGLAVGSEVRASARRVVGLAIVAGKGRAPGIRPWTYLTASRRAFAALNAGTFEAGMGMLSPVRGLRPWRAARRLVLNVPKPAMATLSPSAGTSAMVEHMAVSAESASVLDREAASATRADSSDLFIPVFSDQRLGIDDA